MSLVVFTGAVGFALAPVRFNGLALIATLSAMAAGAGACGALNMWWDADIDARMARTAMRPIPRGSVPPSQALAIGLLLSTVSVAALGLQVNGLAACLLLLTIAVSGGPFLGLLGTVVGVMITFAAIAAAGDVNVNAIAPGIAAALVATVAGLAVAIPALFGYNYLSIQVKNLTADMQVFNDELVTRFAENYSN